MNQTVAPAHFLKDVIARFGGDPDGTARPLPPVHKWNPDFCGVIDMRISPDGQWFYMGSPIGRMPMVKLFASILRREPDGSYVLVTPVEKVGITVEDAPFVAVELVRQGEGEAQQLAVRTNLDDVVLLDADHPLRMAVPPGGTEPVPYIRVRDRLEARVNRPVYYQLVDLAQPAEIGGRELLAVRSCGEVFVLGALDAD